VARSSAALPVDGAGPAPAPSGGWVRVPRSPQAAVTRRASVARWMRRGMAPPWVSHALTAAQGFDGAPKVGAELGWYGIANPPSRAKRGGEVGGIAGAPFEPHSPCHDSCTLVRHAGTRARQRRRVRPGAAAAPADRGRAPGRA